MRRGRSSDGARRTVPAWLLLALSTVLATCASGPAGATPPGEAPIPDAEAEAAADALVRRFAPVIRLQAQPEPCGPGEPFAPIDVTLLFDNPEVALRGPWSPDDLVAVAPALSDVTDGRFGYHLDFPGSALAPGCDYERWAGRLALLGGPTAYARVVREPGEPARLALQYWLFYPYNDYNNKHEGDWEMIQLVFDAPDAGSALRTSPTRVGYSQHEGAEEARWDDPKLERVDGTHPVVFPSAGSHANYFEPALHLGRSAQQGVGCDDTTDPGPDLLPRIVRLPEDAEEARRDHPWLGFEGHWGEKQAAFYNGPTGPNTKPQWGAPLRWADDVWRPRSYAVAGGSLLGPEATSFFCEAIGRGSDLLRVLTARPGPVALALAAALALLAWAARRTRWSGSTPFRLARRRAVGQVLRDAARAYATRPGLFAGIGLGLVPIALLASGLQAAILGVSARALPTDTEGEANGLLLLVAVAVAAGVGLLALVGVLGACAAALRALDQGAPATLGSALRDARARGLPLLGALAIVAGATLALTAGTIGIPVALWLVLRTATFVPVVVLEGQGAMASLRRSAALGRGQLGRSAGVVLGAAGVPLLAGPVLGGVGLLLVDLPLVAANLLSSLVYAGTVPYAGIALTYLYQDLRVRQQLAAQAAPPPQVLEAEL